MSQDIIPFLERGRFGDVVLGDNKKWVGLVRLRILALQGLLGGTLTLQDWYHLSFVRAKDRTKDLRMKFDAYLNFRMRQAILPFLNANGSANVYGQDFFNPLGNYSEMVDLLWDIAASDQYKARRFLKEDSVVVDAGANAGVFSIFAARLAPKGKVFAFEPAKRTFETLLKNTAPYGNISCFHAGLGERKSEGNILTLAASSGSNVFEDSRLAATRLPEDIAGSERITIATIDDFVEENHIPRVDFVKIDTEGYEANILKGARKTIALHRPVIAMSAYHNPGDKEELPRLLKEISPGYVCELHQDNEEDLICYPEK